MGLFFCLLFHIDTSRVGNIKTISVKFTKCIVYFPQCPIVFMKFCNEFFKKLFFVHNNKSKLLL